MLRKVVDGDCLTVEEAFRTAQMMLRGEVPDIQAAAFLGALRTRKESPAELHGFVQALHQEAVTLHPGLAVLDTCGTGGDGLGTFNISTAAALVTAACGVPVAKHGNRAVTGKVGSADVLEALGMNIRLGPDEALRVLERTGMTFLFAPHYHPILKEVSGLRRSLPVATIFNYLGPLVNPFQPAYQVIGVADPALLEAVGLTCIASGRSRVLTVHADNGMDEVSPVGITRICDYSPRDTRLYELDPQALGIGPFPLSRLAGGDAETNAAIMRQILDGTPGAYRQAVILNASAALVAAGRADCFQEGLLMAEEALDSGKARQVLAHLISCSRDGAAVC